MDRQIVLAQEFLESLVSRYPDIDVPLYKFREWYSEEEQVFFDCKNSKLEACLSEAKGRKDHPGFKVFFVVRDMSTGSYILMDVVYPNAFNHSLGAWIDRYHRVLKAGCYMILEGQGREYVEHIGVSYTD